MQQEDNQHESSGVDGIGHRIQNFIKKRLYILDNAQPEQTIEGIKRDIDFSGFNLWILIPAILLASVGLNANSTAVVIGAMLISPLMGPIIGLGLAVGINDVETLRRSLRNLGVMITVSLITSTFFFFIIPLGDASSELLARTKPDIRDVFIGFFGGFAGILAGSRREKNNVIPGVAIATALMPPLCTAGYGLATLQFKYFFGAAYLFLLNAFFIALATVLVVRYLRFPIKTFMDAAKELRAKRILIVTVIIMILPASYIFYTVVQDTFYNRQIKLFVDNNTDIDDTELIKQELIETDTLNYLNLVFLGEKIPQNTLTAWQKDLDKRVSKTKLRVFQGNDEGSNAEMSKVMDLYTRTHEDVMTKEKAILELEKQIEAHQAQNLPKFLKDEIHVVFPEIKAVKMGKLSYADFDEKTNLEVPFFGIIWQKNVSASTKNEKTKQLEIWLRHRLQVEWVEVATM